MFYNKYKRGIYHFLLYLISFVSPDIFKQGYRYRKLRKASFLNFTADTMNCFGMKYLLNYDHCLFGLEFYVESEHKLKKMMGRADFPDQFRGLF